jgi:hypothetical protein
MKHAITTMIVGLAFLLSAQSARAGEPGDTTLTFSDPATATCVQQCIAGTSECLKPPAPKAAPKKVVKRKRKRIRRKRVRRPSCCQILKAEIAKIKVEISSLESSVGILNKKDAEHDKRLAWVDQQLVYLNKWPLRVVKLEQEVREMKKRLEKLNRFEPAIRLSPALGFAIFHSLDGTIYSGGLAGVRIATSLSASVELGVEPLAAFSVSDRPFGTMVRGYLAYHGLTSRFSGEVGFSGAWLGLNNQAEAKALFVTGDVGVTAVLYKGLWLSLRVHAGVEADKGRPSFAVGGIGVLGYEF